MRISDWSSDVCSSDLLPWLAARRAWALHDGAGADAVGGGRAAAEPGAFEPDRRADTDHQPLEVDAGPLRGACLQREAAGCGRSARGGSHAGRRGAAGRDAGGTAPGASAPGRSEARRVGKAEVSTGRK